MVHYPSFKSHLFFFLVWKLRILSLTFQLLWVENLKLVMNISKNAQTKNILNWNRIITVLFDENNGHTFSDYYIISTLRANRLTSCSFWSPSCLLILMIYQVVPWDLIEWYCTLDGDKLSCILPTSQID